MLEEQSRWPHREANNNWLCVAREAERRAGAVEERLSFAVSDELDQMNIRTVHVQRRISCRARRVEKPGNCKEPGSAYEECCFRSVVHGYSCNMDPLACTPVRERGWQHQSRDRLLVAHPSGVKGLIFARLRILSPTF